ncbi:hypothetical protein BD410DRAFT_165729 [Rickenella mellea]|uniref:Ricin B lectin domain-containing protein n=1 Tax=Rickenella mellea TaxID=50990 RepID=A0A4Y7Q9R5_9AGAM|nr:hypothetical protein BD410DRAFT_165729 [Rickenella mellea]
METDKLKSGIYTITNARFRNMVRLNHENKLVGDTIADYGLTEVVARRMLWFVTLHHNGMYTMRNSANVRFFACSPVGKDGITTSPSRHQWNIISTGVEDRYVIQPIDRPDLQWGLEHAELRTPVTLCKTPTNPRNNWEFNPWHGALRQDPDISSTLLIGVLMKEDDIFGSSRPGLLPFNDARSVHSLPHGLRISRIESIVVYRTHRVRGLRVTYVLSNGGRYVRTHGSEFGSVVDVINLSETERLAEVRGHAWKKNVQISSFHVVDLANGKKREVHPDSTGSLTARQAIFNRHLTSVRGYPFRAVGPIIAFAGTTCRAEPSTIKGLSFLTAGNPGIGLKIIGRQKGSERNCCVQ